ncbi:MAG: hypothetical protein VXW97_03360 [Pseudomonadota bacterium]|nr:hypothetical protein [Pseudomonadota bacterium]
MKYLINFQVEVTLKSGKMNKIRSTFTLVEKEIQGILENDFASIKNWFIEYFYKNDLDIFINTAEINEEDTVKLKVGRITNSISGQYKTF